MKKAIRHIGMIILTLACLAVGIAFGSASYIAIESWQRPPIEVQQQPDPCRMPSRPGPVMLAIK